ncbi:uncharacterized protein B0I36DRAFT_360090 [Microdochium trichocladiopsis]|uniref:Copper transporter n=1 Tax=Microdochium trichocladiopsis TaxID=1682393 RepID=A0A9P8YAA7_9PEZI|nr:uncharacterized protein B0I36DRAFT_360090 [Microdochium trichocladiopsis]KAH7034582.1 hypothetical protein B0I36DRAFT_360090 [Microdochium trichocladiopsis]
MVELTGLMVAALLATGAFGAPFSRRDAPAEPMAPTFDECQSQSGITVWSHGMCILGWLIRSHTQFGWVCVMLAGAALLTEAFACLAARYEQKLREKREAQPSLGRRPSVGEVFLRVFYNFFKYVFAGFLVICGAWGNAFWILSAAAGFLLGQTILAFVTPIEGGRDIKKAPKKKKSQATYLQALPPRPRPQPVPDYKRRVRSDPQRPPPAPRRGYMPQSEPARMPGSW